MRFSINNTVFKDATERIAAIVNKKSFIPSATSIKVSASDGHITVATDDVKQFCEITVPADVSEFGEVYLDADAVKKIYNIVGEIEVSTNGSKLAARGVKKGCEIVTLEYDEPFTHPDHNGKFDKLVIEMTNGKMLDILTRLSPAVACADSREVLNGYFFDCKNNKAVAIDGYRMHVIDMFKHEDIHIYEFENFILNGDKLLANLKKLIRKSDTLNYAEFYKNEKTVSYHYATPDYTLTYGINLIEGDYIQYNQILPKEFTHEFSVNTSELQKIAKEYNGYKVANNAMSMLFLNSGMYVYVSDDGFKTYDKVESYKSITESTNEEMLVFNIRYILDAMSVYDDCDVCIGRNRAVHPIVVNHDDMTVLVLPVRQKDMLFDDIKEFITNAA